MSIKLDYLAMDATTQNFIYIRSKNLSFQTVLDMPNIPKEVYLGVGALAGAYCQAHECHGSGSQSPGIASVSQKFASKLHNCKPKGKVDEDYVSV